MPFGFHPTELIIVLVIALIVFGPKRLPEIGSAVGKGLREFRKATSEVKEQLVEPAPPPPVTVPQPMVVKQAPVETVDAVASANE